MRSTMTFLMRLHRIDQLIQEAGIVSFEKMQQELQCSSPTLKRDLRYMREELGAPIVYSYTQNGYYYAQDSKVASKNLQSVCPPIPASWYGADEMFVFMSVLQMLDRIQTDKTGLLSGDMRPLKARLLSLVRSDMITTRELAKRVKVIGDEYKHVNLPYFPLVGYAVSHRRRLRITYFTQGRGVESLREISPLRLVHYKNRWYVDAWCHQSDELRKFAVENIRSAELSKKKCTNVAMRTIEEYFDSTYGIFSGSKSDRLTAKLQIDATMAPYVRNEIWHREQNMTSREDGSLVLEVPYARETELLSRILGLGIHARVLSPASLAERVAEEAAAVLRQYDGSLKGGAA
ncbi:MAG: helix-turn-helix transcriptional regulator [Duodenibacillus sp.]